MKSPLRPIAALAFGFLVACAGCKKTDAPSSSSAGKRYAFKVEGGATPSIRVTPEAGWKINLEYPHRFEGKSRASGAAVQVGKEKARVADQELVIPVAVTPGDTCEGTAYFAICTAKTCIPVEEKVTLSAAK